MADPILDETYIIDDLAAPVSLEHLTYIKRGSVQALLDMHDRQLTRENFLQMAGDAVSLYAMLARFEILDSLGDLFKSGTLKQETFDKAFRDLTNLIVAKQDQVRKHMEFVMQCPTSADKVH